MFFIGFIVGFAACLIIEVIICFIMKKQYNKKNDKEGE